MKLVTSLLVFAVFFAAGFSANARPPRSTPPPAAPAPAPAPVSSSSGYTGLQEVQIGTIGAGSFLSTKAGKDTLSVIEARGSYSRVYYRDNVQLGGELHFYSTSGGAKSQSFFEFGVFGNWNFDTSFENAFYGKAGLGSFAVINDKGDYENKFGLMAGGGRRIPIWSHVNYNPEARLYKKGDQDPAIEIIFINVSLLW